MDLRGLMPLLEPQRDILLKGMDKQLHFRLFPGSQTAAMIGRLIFVYFEVRPSL